MRPDGLWHPRLLAVLAGAGHGDLVVVADPGLPVPAGVEIVDLVWARDQPPLVPVLTAVLAECVVEQATLAAELTDPGLSTELAAVLADIGTDRVSHEELKRLTGNARVVVRTGTATPYANVVLHCGVPF